MRTLIWFVCFLSAGFFASMQSVFACSDSCGSPPVCPFYGAPSLNSCESKPPHLDSGNWIEQNNSRLVLEYIGTSEVSAEEVEKEVSGSPCVELQEFCVGPKPIDDDGILRTAIQKERISEEERKTLMALFTDLGKGEIAAEEKMLNDLPPSIKKTASFQFLNANWLTKQAKFKESAPLYEKVYKTTDSALGEPALFWAARIYYFATAKDFSGYFTPASVTDEGRKSAQKSLELLREYVRKYPKNKKWNWAFGLRRRVALYLGDFDAFSTFVNESLDHAILSGSPNPQFIKSVLNEWEGFTGLTPLDIKAPHPLQWVVRSYYVLRGSSFGDGPWAKASPAEELKELEAQRANFANFTTLYKLTRANLLYGAGRYKEALEQLPPAKINKGRLWGSSLTMLHARILVGLKRFEEARKLVLTMREQIHFAQDFIALTFLLEGQPQKAISSSYREKLDVKNLKKLMESSIALNELEKLLTNKDVPDKLKVDVAEIALAKALFLADYQAFRKIFVATPLDVQKKFNEIKTAVDGVLKAPGEPKFNLKIGDFLNERESPAVRYQVCQSTGKADSAIKVHWPLDYYRSAIEAAKGNERNEAEAEALARAIQCFSTGNGNNCRGNGYRDEAGIPERKGWFKKLHSKYPNSKAARETKIYW